MIMFFITTTTGVESFNSCKAIVHRDRTTCNCVGFGSYNENLWWIGMNVEDDVARQWVFTVAEVEMVAYFLVLAYNLVLILDQFSVHLSLWFPLFPYFVFD
jgi:apolipoprotein N-acyltransferase